MNKKKTRINLLLEIILWLVSIVTIYPMLMVLLTSFKNKGEAAYMNISLPSEWHPENYIAVLEKDFMRSLGNSVFITFISVALIVSLSAFLSFIIVRRDTKGCRIGYKIITLGIIALRCLSLLVFFPHFLCYRLPVFSIPVTFRTEMLRTLR